MDYSYTLKYQTKNPSFKYFIDHPISEWSFTEFARSFNDNKPEPTNIKKIKNTYFLIIKDIQKLNNIPDFVQKEVQRLISLMNSPEEDPQSINFNITVQELRIYNASGSDAESSEETSDDENKILSDLSIDYHPYRTCEYNLKIVDSDEEGDVSEGDEERNFISKERNTISEERNTISEERNTISEERNTISEERNSTRKEKTTKWMLKDVCISDLCLGFKETSLNLAKSINPSQLSDICLLALNDIYKFDKDLSSSVSKYFSIKIHTMLKPTLSLDAYLPTRGLNCYGWCLDIEVSPPVDYITSITLCADLLKKACDSKNLLDIHTAQILTQILPVLVNGPPEDTTEDRYVHYYLAPLLSSVFSTDPLLKMKWANGKLMNNQNEYTPDFLVYNAYGSKKCVIFIAEFKPTEKNSYVESDLVKLAKQMKKTLNEMIIDGVSNPKICGVHCEGENVSTYVMDLPSPRIYRLVNMSTIKLFNNLFQISLLPSVITHLLYLKNVASKTAAKAETASLYSYNNLKRQAPNPPKDWLSSSKAVLSRLPKKQKK